MQLPIIIAAAAAGGLAVGYFVKSAQTKNLRESIERKTKGLVEEAKHEADKVLAEAKREGAAHGQEIKDTEKRLREREEGLDRRYEKLDEVRDHLEADKTELTKRAEAVEGIHKEQTEKLSQIAKWKKEDARDYLLKEIERDYAEDLVKEIRKHKETLQEAADSEARKIISLAIQRLATEHASEQSSAPVQIPNEEMKGRIIGKEGRNIQQFEKVTGVDVIIDDSPDTVIISSFDPVRRHVAKRALEHLIAGGIIQPAKIEDTVEKVTKEIAKEMKEAAEAALQEVGISGIHPDLVKILGRLKFRTSYGQNVLQHTIEAAHIGAIMATELGADINVVKKGVMFHDIGKALDHDVPGTHVQIGVDLLKKYGLSEAVIHTVAAHHNDIEPKTVEAIIVQAADAISGARPGARRESYESYIRRLTELENIATGFEGVEKAYAIQAGREVRIFVKPEKVTDLEAHRLARSVAKKIEGDMQYPGQIKVHVIRETRAVEFAK